jgi:hypothetical protein
MSNAPVAKVYYFPSSSKPGTHHEVLERTDGFLSCGCPVWIFNRRKTEPRSCSHTDKVKAGLVQPNIIHSQTDEEKAMIGDRGLATPASTSQEDSIDRNARRNRPAMDRVLGRNLTRLRERITTNAQIAASQPGRVEERLDNTKKLARIKERLDKVKKDQLESAAPTRKVNWKR